jgi:hypothetical protein
MWLKNLAPKNPTKSIRLVIFVLLLVLMGIVAYMQVMADQETHRTHPPTPDDFPLVETDLASDYTPKPTKVISKIVDLAQGLPDEEKRVYIVQRADGSSEKYIVTVGHREDLHELLQMGPHDKIVNSFPLKPIEPPHMLTPPTPVDIPTQPGYPPPLYITEEYPATMEPVTYP